MTTSFSLSQVPDQSTVYGGCVDISLGIISSIQEGIVTIGILWFLLCSEHLFEETRELASDVHLRSQESDFDIYQRLNAYPPHPTRD